MFHSRSASHSASSSVSSVSPSGWSSPSESSFSESSFSNSFTSLSPSLGVLFGAIPVGFVPILVGVSVFRGCVFRLILRLGSLQVAVLRDFIHGIVCSVGTGLERTEQAEQQKSPKQRRETAKEGRDGQGNSWKTPTMKKGRDAGAIRPWFAGFAYP